MRDQFLKEYAEQLYKQKVEDTFYYIDAALVDKRFSGTDYDFNDRDTIMFTIIRNLLKEEMIRCSQPKKEDEHEAS